MHKSDIIPNNIENAEVSLTGGAGVAEQLKEVLSSGHATTSQVLATISQARSLLASIESSLNLAEASIKES